MCPSHPGSTLQPFPRPLIQDHLIPPTPHFPSCPSLPSALLSQGCPPSLCSIIARHHVAPSPARFRNSSGLSSSRTMLSTVTSRLCGRERSPPTGPPTPPSGPPTLGGGGASPAGATRLDPAPSSTSCPAASGKRRACVGEVCVRTLRSRLRPLRVCLGGEGECVCGVRVWGEVCVRGGELAFVAGAIFHLTLRSEGIKRRREEGEASRHCVCVCVCVCVSVFGVRVCGLLACVRVVWA